eukprot:COSAG01_NODE_3923_length_5530_cov_16.244338_3_plen_213_part_00
MATCGAGSGGSGTAVNRSVAAAPLHAVKHCRLGSSAAHHSRWRELLHGGSQRRLVGLRLHSQRLVQVLPAVGALQQVGAQRHHVCQDQATACGGTSDSRLRRRPGLSQLLFQSTPRLTSACATRVGSSHIPVRVEIMGPGKYENVGKSQSVLIVINARSRKRRAPARRPARPSAPARSVLRWGHSRCVAGRPPAPTHPCGSWRARRFSQRSK